MSPPVRKVNLAEMFGRFQDQWSPKIVGEVNDNLVKLTKLTGEFVWHHHDREDELFLVVKGRLRMKLPNGTTWSVANYDHSGYGHPTLRRATAYFARTSYGMCLNVTPLASSRAAPSRQLSP